MKKLILLCYILSASQLFAAVPSVNIMSYGADPKGVRDSREAFQKAADDANNLSIDVPPGVYLVNYPGFTNTVFGKQFKGVTGGQNGYQSVLKAGRTNMTIVTVKAGRSLFTDLTIQGEASHPDGDGTVVGAYMDFADLDAEFDNVTFSDLRTCIDAGGRNLTIKNSTLLSFWDGLVWRKPTTGESDIRGLDVKNCRIHGARNRVWVFTPGDGLFHAHFVGNLYDGFNIATPFIGEINDLHIVGDKIQRVLGNCIALTNNLAGFSGTELDPGNSIDSVKITYRNSVPWGDGILLSGPNWRVRNLDMTGAPNNAFRLNYGTNSIIADSNIDGSGTHGIILSQSPGVMVNNTRISNWGTNQVAATHYSGIYAIDVNTNIVINGNVLNSNPSLALCDGISLQTVNGQVKNCTVVGANIGIFVGTQCTNVPITGCTVINCATGISDSSDVTYRMHANNTTINCATPIFGAGPTRAESLTADFITVPLLSTSSNVTVMSSSLSPTREKVFSIRKTGGGANGGIDFLPGDTGSEIAFQPSPGLTAQTAIMSIWDGGNLRQIINAATNGDVTIPYNLTIVGLLSAATFSVNTLTTSNLVVTTSGTFGGNISTSTNIYGARVYVTNTVYSRELQFRDSSFNAQSYMESGGTDGNIIMGNAAGSDFGSLIFGSSSASHFRFKKSGATMQAKLGNDSAFTSMTALGWQTANKTTAPTAASLGANGGMFWSSNGIPYYTYSLDGSSATTKAISLVP